MLNRDSEAPLFPSTAGGYRNLANFKRATNWAKVSRGRRIHDLRHTAATFLIQNGMYPKTAHTWLGHVTATLTLDTYTHWLGTDADAAAIARINQVL